MSMSSNNEPMQINSTAAPVSNSVFTEPVKSQPMASFKMRAPQRSLIKMSATNSNFDGPEFFNKNLNDMTNIANQSKARVSRASVVMQATTTEADPKVTGAYDTNEHLMEGF